MKSKKVSFAFRFAALVVLMSGLLYSTYYDNFVLEMTFFYCAEFLFASSFLVEMILDRKYEMLKVVITISLYVVLVTQVVKFYS